MRILKLKRAIKIYAEDGSITFSNKTKSLFLCEDTHNYYCTLNTMLYDAQKHKRIYFCHKNLNRSRATVKETKLANHKN